MSGHSIPTHKHYLHALDGLRFFAALFVITAHVMGVTFKVYKARHASELLDYVGSFAGFGMTLFFVLSGFVIHYNYHLKTSRWNRKAMGNFMFARFSRLYPLYFVVVMLDVYFSYRKPAYHENFLHAPEALSYHLTMTQAWFYKLIGGHPLIDQFALMSSVSWSISVEIFLYMTYIILALWLLRMKTLRTQCLIAALFFAAFVIGNEIFKSNLDAINGWAALQFGTIADMRKGEAGSFVFWLMYFSPLTRIMEFMLGCIAANILLQAHQLPWLNTARSTYITVFLLVSCIALQLTLATYYPKYHIRSQFCAPIVAALIYMLARYENPVQRFFSSKILCKGGETSYSIYLLQFVILRQYAQFSIPPEFGLGWPLLLKGLMALAIIITAARFSYLLFELPARNLIRRQMCWRTLPRYLYGIICHRKALLALLLGLHLLLCYYDHVLGEIF